MKKSRFTEDQIAFALKQAETGTPVAEVLRRMGISEQTFYLYGRLSHCKTAVNGFSDPWQTSIRRHGFLPERPNGESEHAHLYSW